MKNEKIFFLPSFLLLVAYIIKLTVMPNQLLVMLAAYVTILVFLIVFLRRMLKKSETIGGKVIHIVFFVLIILSMALPFVGVLNQGIVPITIYFLLLIATIVYLFKVSQIVVKFPTFLYPNNYRTFVLLNLFLIVLNSPFLFVIPDKLYSPNFTPEYEKGKGPDLYVDEAHANHHTASGLYKTFAEILEKDGYNVKPFTNKFSEESLNNVKLLVISNAIHSKNSKRWEQPIFSAFEEAEMQQLTKWVENGGSLFLIADHMPFSSSAKELASKFGFTFYGGTAMKKKGETKKLKGEVDLFYRSANTLMKNAITDGRNASEYVDSIATFTGQAFEIPDSAQQILVFNNEYEQFAPKAHGQIESTDEAQDITGFSQGAFMNFGKGRIVVFGEAAMFTTQLPAGLSWKKIGMNSSKATNNYKLLLNIIHWLDKKY